MTKTKTIFITFTVFLSLILIYMIAATFINIGYLYEFSYIVLIFLFVISLVIALSKKKIFIYKDKLSKSILIFALIVLSFTNIYISKAYIEKLKNTDYYTLNSYTKAIILNSEVKKEYKEYKSKNLTLLYRKSSEPAIPLIEEYINQTKIDAEKIYKDVTYNPLTIKVTDPETFNEDLIVNDFTGGYYYEDLKQIKIPLSDIYKEVLSLEPINEFRFVLRHEYTHYISHMYRIKNSINRDSIPVWFEEGIASFIGAGDRPTPNIMTGSVIPFKNLTSPEEWQSKDAYEQSYRMIYILVYEHGEDVLEEILFGLKSMTFDESFKKATGKSLKYYEGELEKYNQLGFEGFPIIDVESNDVEKIEELRIKGLEKYIEKNPENKDAIRELERLKGSEF
ncbi:collagenase [Senegalia sp. (in: firmicutes)]|uniref:collagenase n=1 Tax=Senegalia sp. (in: firmicutes) TaxID=1924098 RepID=UPI003F9B8B52